MQKLCCLPERREEFGTNAGNVALTESWAEFLGMNHQIRKYGETNAVNTCTNSNTYQEVVGGPLLSVLARRVYPSSQLQENQFYFFDRSWIPHGLYHDLMDDSTSTNSNRTERWDRIQGVTIQQMYEAFAPNIGNMCEYESNFLNRNTNLNQGFVFDIFKK
jgi:hypothetical protein